MFNWDSLYEIHKLDGSLVGRPCCYCWCCYAKKHRQAGTARGTSVLVAVSSQREWVWPLTRFASRKWRSELNRISHPDWVKLSVEINLRAKPKYEIFLFSTHSIVTVLTTKISYRPSIFAHPYCFSSINT